MQERKTKPYFVVHVRKWCMELDNSKERIWSDNPSKNDAQGLDNPLRNSAWELDNFRSKIFAVELDNSKWELDTSLWKIFVLELDNSN